MKHRNPVAVLLLPFVTFGIYSIVWYVKTKNEMNRLGADIPTAWLLIVPIANIWWVWKYSEGVERITAGKSNSALSFLLMYLLGSIGQMVVQMSFNEVAAGGVAGGQASYAANGYAAAPQQFAQAPQQPAEFGAAPAPSYAPPAQSQQPVQPQNQQPPTPPNQPLVQ